MMSFSRSRALLNVCVASSMLVCAGAWSQETLSHGRFKDVRMYRPAVSAKSVVLLLSGQDGWTSLSDALARNLASRGALVAGIDVPKLYQDLEGDGDACVVPDGDLENLSHYVQGYAKLPTYHAPFLVGHGSGATLAYAMIAQAPAGTFSGAISVGFCPELELKKPLCRGEGAARQTPWLVLQGAADRACPVNTAEKFTGPAEAQLIPLPGVAHDYAARQQSWMPQFLGAQLLGISRAALSLSSSSRSLPRPSARHP